MANVYGIGHDLEKKLRATHKKCVFCGIAMKTHAHSKGTPGDKATFEHLDNNGSMNKENNVVMCCGSCNSSKGTKSLATWLKSDYCKKYGITKNSVASVVKKYL